MLARIRAIILVAVMFPLNSIAQKFLVLEKLGTRKRFEYNIGDEITYQLHGEDHFRTDVIIQLETNVIAFGYAFYTFDKIAVINIGKKPRNGFDATRLSPYLLLGGAGYFLIDQFNNSIINGNSLSVSDNVLRTSAILVGAGTFPLILKKRRVKLRRNWRLRLVDI